MTVSFVDFLIGFLVDFFVALVTLLVVAVGAVVVTGATAVAGGLVVAAAAGAAAPGTVGEGADPGFTRARAFWLRSTKFLGRGA